jgi:hypothetical protein
LSKRILATLGSLAVLAFVYLATTGQVSNPVIFLGEAMVGFPTHAIPFNNGGVIGGDAGIGINTTFTPVFNPLSGDQILGIQKTVTSNATGTPHYFLGFLSDITFTPAADAISTASAKSAYFGATFTGTHLTQHVQGMNINIKDASVGQTANSVDGLSVYVWNSTGTIRDEMQGVYVETEDDVLGLDNNIAVSQINYSTWGTLASFWMFDDAVYSGPSFSGAGTLPELGGLHIGTPTNTGGGTITTVYGVKVEDQTAGATNYALYTGAGAVRLGALAGSNGFVKTTSGVLSVDTSTYLTTAVTSATGTANQITVSASTGAVTWSIPASARLSVAKLTNLTTNGFVKTGSADGSLSIDTSTYLTSADAVTSATGTSNQVIVSGSTGAVTWSLPQSIGTSSTPQFGRLGLGAAADATAVLSTTFASTATSGTVLANLLTPTFNPSSTSTMVGVGLKIAPTINYSAGTPGAGNYEALKIAVTETANPTGTNYLIRASGGAASTTDRFTVDSTGKVTIAASAFNPQALNFTSSGGGTLTLALSGIAVLNITAPGTPASRIGVQSLSIHSSLTSSGDIFLERDAAATLAIRNSTTAQAVRIYNTWTDASNGEWLTLNAASNIFHIGATKNGSGTARVMQLDYGGTTTSAISIPITSGDITFGGVLAPTGYKSSDGTAGATTTCTIAGLTSITVKNGLITACS